MGFQLGWKVPRVVIYCIMDSFLVFPTGTEEHEPLDERSWRKKIPRSFLLRTVQLLRRKCFYPSRIIHPWSLLNTSGISGPSHAVIWLYFKVLAPVDIGMNIPYPSSWKIPRKENKWCLTYKVLKWLWLRWWISLVLHTQKKKKT